MALPAVRHLSYEEYLDLERETGIKHEYYAGEVVAMAGGTADHALIASRLIGELYAALRGSPCRPFTSDWKIWLESSGRAVYPDVSVICGAIARPLHDANAATNPTLIAEVLSPHTEDHDQGSKAREYRDLPSLQHLLLIDTRRVRVDLQTRQPDGGWTLRAYGPTDTLPLTALGISIPVAELYADTELQNPP